MLKIIIETQHKDDIAYALPRIVEMVVEGYTSGETGFGRVTWRIEED